MSQPCTIITGDARTALQSIEAGSVQCCVTSPPYWGLRDYGVAGQIGLEETPELWLAEMVAVFRQVHRVLRDDGTLWLNIGDAYAGSRKGGYPNPETSTLQGPVQGQDSVRQAKRTMATTASRRRDDADVPRSDVRVQGCKPKDLIGLPWMLAFALRADGWYLRSDIIWHKPNPMPESVRDRPTKSHEYIFLLSKSERYFYDAEAIAEKCSENTHARVAQGQIKTPDGWDTSKGEGGHGAFHKNGREAGHKMPPISGKKAVGAGGNGNATYSGNTPEFKRARPPGVNPKCVEVGGAGDHRGPRPKQNDSFSAAVSGPVYVRNSRTVWTIPTEATSEKHFASFPRELARRCILAGCPAGSLVLDPFAGTGTVGQVALATGRRALLVELNPDYVAMIRRRLEKNVLLFAGMHP